MNAEMKMMMMMRRRRIGGRCLEGTLCKSFQEN
jgi:hypothetical protein